MKKINWFKKFAVASAGFIVFSLLVWAGAASAVTRNATVQTGPSNARTSRGHVSVNWKNTYSYDHGYLSSEDLSDEDGHSTKATFRSTNYGNSPVKTIHNNYGTGHVTAVSGFEFTGYGNISYGTLKSCVVKRFWFDDCNEQKLLNYYR